MTRATRTTHDLHPTSPGNGAVTLNERPTPCGVDEWIGKGMSRWRRQESNLSHRVRKVTFSLRARAVYGQGIGRRDTPGALRELRPRKGEAAHGVSAAPGVIGAMDSGWRSGVLVEAPESNLDLGPFSITLDIPARPEGGRVDSQGTSDPRSPQSHNLREWGTQPPRWPLLVGASGSSNLNLRRERSQITLGRRPAPEMRGQTAWNEGHNTVAVCPCFPPRP